MKKILIAAAIMLGVMSPSIANADHGFGLNDHRVIFASDCSTSFAPGAVVCKVKLDTIHEQYAYAWLSPDDVRVAALFDTRGNQLQNDRFVVANAVGSRIFEDGSAWAPNGEALCLPNELCQNDSFIVVRRS